MKYEERLANLRRHIDGGTLVREEWGDGYEHACFMGALSPEAAGAQDPEACPAEVMPLWLAHLVPWMNDEGTLEAWPQMVERFYRVATRWQVLDDAAWERARSGSLIGIVRHARGSCPADETEALAAIDGVLDWLRRGAPEGEREKVRSAAEAAEWAEWAKSAAAKSAKSAKAKWAAAKSAKSAAAKSAAAKSAAWAAWAAAAATWAAAAEKAAVDEITSGTLSAIEAECDQAEGKPVSPKLDLQQVRLAYSPLSDAIYLIRNGKDPRVALERRSADREVMTALIEHMMQDAPRGSSKSVLLGDQWYDVTVRPISPPGGDEPEVR